MYCMKVCRKRPSLNWVKVLCLFEISQILHAPRSRDSVPQRHAPVPAIGLGRRAQLGAALAAVLGIGAMATDAAAQAVEVRQWQGKAAVTRQPAQVMAHTQAEWRSLWSRVGQAAPDLFEPGRTNAVGIFLGPRTDGHAINLISANRRRDRIVVVFEERVAPSANVLAERQPPAPPPAAPARPVASTPMPSGGASFAGNSAALTAPSPSVATRTAPGPTTSPWAIILINRTDLPISVEQRLYR
jgi:hypothetical protein